MAGAFDHGLDIVALRDLVELAKRLEFGELRGVVGVRDGTGAQAVTERERNVILFQELADVLKMRVKEILLVMRETPFGEDRAAARYDAGDAVRSQRDVRQAQAR